MVAVLTCELEVVFIDSIELPSDDHVRSVPL
jgi:hypothetical protein